jgi:hypothetical protein
MYLIRRLTSLVVVASALAWLTLSSPTQAVIPPPDGGYGPLTYGTGNTAEGEDALFKLTTGGYNTAIGYISLWSNTTGSFNTAIGSATLLANTANENTAIVAGHFYSTPLAAKTPPMERSH